MESERESEIMGSGIAKINRNIAENLNPDVRVLFFYVSTI